MSLIREALKKAGEGKEPEILLPDQTGKKKKLKTSQLLQYGLLIFLLIGLVGVLVYFFLPGSTPSKKIPGPPALKPLVTKAEIKPPDTGPAGGRESLPPINPLKPEGKGSLPTPTPISPPKPESKGFLPIPLKESKETKEKEMAEVSERFFKAPSSRFLTPRPTAKARLRPSLPSKLVTEAKPPSEVPDPPPAQTTSEGLDSLPIVRLFNEAVRNQQKGLYPQAIQGYQEVLAERPNHWETYNNLGLIYQNQKQYTKSLEHFQKALSLNPRYLKGHNNLGLLYLNMGKLEEAINQFRKGLEQDPEFIPAYINLGVAYKRQGQIEAARKTLQKALEHDAENLEAHYNLGLLWEQEGVENKALEHYQKFVSKAQGPYGEIANELRKRWPGLK